MLDFHHIKVIIHVNLTIKIFFLVLFLFRVVDAHSIYWLHKVIEIYHVIQIEGTLMAICWPKLQATLTWHKKFLFVQIYN